MKLDRPQLDYSGKPLDPLLAVQALLDIKKGVSISHTLMSNIEACPRRAFLSLVVDRKRTRDDRTNFFAGSVVHDLFKVWVQDRKYEDGWLKAQAHQAFVKAETSAPYLSWRDGRPDATKRGVALSKVIRAVDAVESLSKFLLFREHGVMVEHWVTIQIPNSHFRLRGSIDIYDPVTKTMYDMKITENTTWTKPAQLAFYAALMFLDRKEWPEHAYFLYPLLGSPLVSVEVSRDCFKALVKPTVEDALNRLTVGNFPADPLSSNDCFQCNYKSWCPRFGGEWTP